MEIIFDVENNCIIELIWFKGVGIIYYLHCPHYDEPERVDFDAFYSGQIADAIAIENQVAVVWDDYEIYVIKSNPNKNAYKLSWSDTGLNKEVLFLVFCPVLGLGRD